MGVLDSTCSSTRSSQLSTGTSRTFFKPCRPYDDVPSSELLRCNECGQTFDTVESLREHMKSENDEKKNRVKGLSDG
jgi:hypothetical protein